MYIEFKEIMRNHFARRELAKIARKERWAKSMVQANEDLLSPQYNVEGSLFFVVCGVMCYIGGARRHSLTRNSPRICGISQINKQGLNLSRS